MLRLGAEVAPVLTWEAVREFALRWGSQAPALRLWPLELEKEIP